MLVFWLISASTFGYMSVRTCKVRGGVPEKIISSEKAMDEFGNSVFFNLNPIKDLLRDIFFFEVIAFILTAGASVIEIISLLGLNIF